MRMKYCEVYCKNCINRKRKKIYGKMCPQNTDVTNKVNSGITPEQKKWSSPT